MFTKITLENFRSFDHIVFDLTEKGNVPKHLAVLYGESNVCFCFATGVDSHHGCT